MKKLNKKNLKKASPTLLSCFGAVGVIGTSALAVKATPKALRKIRADSRENHNDRMRTQNSKLFSPHGFIMFHL